MTANPRDSEPAPSSGWLPGLFLGGINGIALISLGAIGLPLLALTLVLIAWKGPRPLAFAGLLTGAGLIWTVLFARLGLSCIVVQPLAGEDCSASGIAPWVAVAAATLVSGLVASVFAFRRARRGREPRVR